MIRHVTSQRQDGGRGNMLVTCPTPFPSTWINPHPRTPLECERQVTARPGAMENHVRPWFI